MCPLLAPRLQHMGKHVPLPLLTIYSIATLSKDSVPMWGAYWLVYPCGRQGIGGSRGHAWHTHPPWDPIISFSHTFSVKSTCIAGPHPPNGSMPPMGPNPFVFAHIFGEKCLHLRSMPPLMGPHPSLYGKTWIHHCRAMPIGYGITKGGTERCIVRLLLTVRFPKETFQTVCFCLPISYLNFYIMAWHWAVGGRRLIFVSCEERP